MKRAILTLSVTAIALTACNDKIVQEANNTSENNEIEVKEKQKKDEELQKKQEEILKDLEKPLDEVISNNELDQVTLLPLSETEMKETYKNPSELAIHVSDVLFKFYKGELTPEEFYQFLKKYGSKSVKENLTDKENSIIIYQNVQSLYREKNPDIESFVITEPVLSGSKKEAYFYRKVTSPLGEEYNVTTLVLEGGSWKFLEDSPSPPFEILKEDELMNTEEEPVNDK